MKAKRILLVSVFLMSLIVGFLLNESKAAPPGWQCSTQFCTYICWCTGSMYIKYDECCLYCYNNGIWLDCCSDSCYPK